MKCDNCEKPASFHITELTDSRPQELHFCEEHARQYLAHPDESVEDTTTSLAGALAEQLSVGQTAEQLAELDQRACPICGITFYEFRNKGRLGCPHDYTCFESELEPLITNIHGESEHLGKAPKRSPADTEERTKLIRMRRDMKDAVAEECYERATELRDEIKQLEKTLKDSILDESSSTDTP